MSKVDTAFEKISQAMTQGYFYEVPGKVADNRHEYTDVAKPQYMGKVHNNNMVVKEKTQDRDVVRKEQWVDKSKKAPMENEKVSSAVASLHQKWVG